jgi:NAD(P)-dependent dehydrogenase (short-subunit alcohol dehydrogenase family)
MRQHRIHAAAYDRMTGPLERAVLSERRARLPTAVGGQVLDITDRDWDRLIGVNLRGVLVVTQRVLPSMLSRRSGRILNISSMVGQEGLPNLAHYCATKFGGDRAHPVTGQGGRGAQRDGQRRLPRRGPHAAVG